MTGEKPPEGYLSLSSDDLPRERRVDHFRETYSTFVVACDIETTNEDGFWGTLESRKVGDVTVARVAGSEMTCRIDPDNAARTESGVLIDTMTDGRVLFEQNGRSNLLTVGTTHLCVTHMPFRYDHEPGFASRSVVIPERLLQGAIGDIERLAGLTMTADTPEMKLLHWYTGSVELARPYEAAIEQTFSRHMVEIGVSAITRLLRREDPTEGRGIRNARFLQVQKVIDSRFEQPTFSATAAARQLGVTPRYIQKLAEGAGTTFSAMLMEKRLVEAHKRLGRDERPDLTIQEIAWSVGFSDASHFTRTFRRRFGETPTAIRGTARSPQGL